MSDNEGAVGEKPRSVAQPPTLVFASREHLNSTSRGRVPEPLPSAPVRTPHDERSFSVSAPRLDIRHRIPVAGASSFLNWSAGDVYARLAGASVVVTREVQKFGRRASIDSRFRLSISPAGRVALAASAGELLLVVAVAQSERSSARLVVSSLASVAAEFLDEKVPGHD